MINMLIGLRDWVDDRFPLMQMWDDHMGKYYAPKNFNFWYFFGVLSLLVLVNQLLTGIWLTMSYNPSQEGAFASVITSYSIHYTKLYDILASGYVTGVGARSVAWVARNSGVRK